MGGDGDDRGGCFKVPSPVDKAPLCIIAAADEGWDHLSVSRDHRSPSWRELEHVKRLFFRDDEAAMQLHVSPTSHVNVHPNCLHLWRPHHIPIPMPPVEFV